MSRGRHRHSLPAYRLLPPAALAAGGVTCAIGVWVVASGDPGDTVGIKVLASTAGLAAVVGAALLRYWDRVNSRREGELRARLAVAENRADARQAELEAELQDVREIRQALEEKVRGKGGQLARLRTEHAALLQRYARAESERARALEGRRQLAIEAARPAKELAAGATDHRNKAGAPTPLTYLQASEALRNFSRNLDRQRRAAEAERLAEEARVRAERRAAAPPQGGFDFFGNNSSAGLTGVPPGGLPQRDREAGGTPRTSGVGQPEETGEGPIAEGRAPEGEGLPGEGAGPDGGAAPESGPVEGPHPREGDGSGGDVHPGEGFPGGDPRPGGVHPEGGAGSQGWGRSGGGVHPEGGDGSGEGPTYEGYPGPGTSPSYEPDPVPGTDLHDAVPERAGGNPQWGTGSWGTGPQRGAPWGASPEQGYQTVEERAGSREGDGSPLGAGPDGGTAFEGGPVGEGAPGSGQVNEGAPADSGVHPEGGFLAEGADGQPGPHAGPGLHEGGFVEEEGGFLVEGADPGAGTRIDGEQVDGFLAEGTPVDGALVDGGDPEDRTARVADAPGAASSSRAVRPVAGDVVDLGDPADASDDPDPDRSGTVDTSADLDDPAEGNGTSGPNPSEGRDEAPTGTDAGGRPTGGTGGSPDDLDITELRGAI
ncbi:hypothetical protein [Streptomyces sp. NPDC005438]|uniref:hypothetical protein n=1 Tax=Streptomyces sp. NPDC005438 TaxID=3156880 RepID=UPI0033B92A23